MKTTKHNAFLAFSFSQGFSSPNIPITTFTQGDKELNFIIDTGSDKNIIDKSALEGLEYSKFDADIRLTGLGGSQNVEGCTLTFTHDGKDYIAEFLISDLGEAFTAIRKAHAIPLHGMIGSTFLAQNNIIMDFTKMVAYNKD